MERRTKIIATIGPARDSETTLRQLVDAGMDVARLGLAHGTLDEALERYRRVRKISKDMGKRVGILVDLPGPKIRSAPFPGEGSLKFLKSNFGGTVVQRTSFSKDILKK